MKWLYVVLTFLLIFANTKAKNKALPLRDRNDQILTDPVEPSPSFPGGQKALNRFLARNLKWPSDEYDDTTGKVVIGFVVEKDGRLTNFKVLRSLGGKFDAEALRVLRKSPKWIPAGQNGKALRTKYMLPINFTTSS